jgi:hypothetical protein
MINKPGRVFATLCILALAVACVAPALAQMSDTKEKPPMYSYVSDWAIPRTQWADMEKNNAADEPILSKALAAGTLIGYGDDVNLIHQPDGPTHDDWWSSMSLAGLLNVLDQFYKAGNAVNPVLSSATKHFDSIFVSRYYNWHSGSWKGAYTHVSEYKFKADAPDDALGLVSKNFIVPMMEKLLADGTLHEYEIDTEAEHTESPNSFWIVYVTANAEGMDKVNAALEAALKASPFAGPAFGSMVDFSVHRDYLARTNATFK